MALCQHRPPHIDDESIHPIPAGAPEHIHSDVKDAGPVNILWLRYQFNP